ncbi:uncharacterized protein NECHADRAFT_34572 [Fusarium vanettenii 77-13-4]|uniref:Amino acid permease/ SLC12A domain-containing protein n=1 Tax=Fusarium vanettenii (strain ATCC MYA-4622 / CBS 123669 / FGSC 9596 / NRRL 45880 / 77-13-4) TaxID=660122 RepID=C7ZCK4_FUSV7|nr:uncharacterized protein NECHADRAFT_34572 [Fusarium vanettenii 77-13-4]EEU38383.1 hypothetical protein NECHADRAFT_34572 [Fusarium vanettenii 77-13-4]
MSSDEKDSYKGVASPNPELSNNNEGDNADGLHRRLNNRQIQLIAIGGTIGTGLFIGIGAGLAKGGPGSLLVCTALYSCVLALVNNSIAEMTTYMPVSGGFIRLAGAWVDDALGFMVGWNFFFYEALLIPFEIVALNLVLSFWNDNITNAGPTAGFCAAIIVSYGVLNVLAVGVFGEAEFWLSAGKVILILILFAFTFVTMVGGNPQHHAYGFTYWKDAHDAFATYRTEGDLGRLEGFMGAMAAAAFYVVGPDYISMVAAEAKHPSRYIKTAFKTVYFRFGLFFIGAALTCGIVLDHKDPKLVSVHLGDGDSSTAAASPYVIAMKNMGIDVLPHVVNALLFTTIYSAGNTYTYCATRSLYSLALEGRAPAFLRKTTKNGVPIYCFAVTMLFPLLSFLQLDSSSSEALSILLALITGGGIVDYITMSITFLFYYRACKVQGVDRKKMPYYGYFQPYGAWIALVLQIVVVYTYGYTSLAPFNAKNFFSNYTMQIIAPFLYLGWKLLKRTKLVKAEECDLVWERPGLDAYEERMMILEPPTSFWTETRDMFRFKQKKSVPDVHV